MDAPKVHRISSFPPRNLPPRDLDLQPHCPLIQIEPDRSIGLLVEHPLRNSPQGVYDPGDMRRRSTSGPDVDDDSGAGVPGGEPGVEPCRSRERRETGDVGEDGEVDVLDWEVGV